MTEIRTPSFSGTRLSVQSSALPVSSHPYSSDPPTSSHHQEEVLTPKSSISDLTAVNHSQAACLGRNSGNANPNTLESGTPGDDALGHRIVSSRSQSLLIFLIASQLAAFLAFLLEIAAVKVGLSPSLGSDASASNYAIIHILRTAFMVLCITGIMTAFLRTSNPILSRFEHPPYERTQFMHIILIWAPVDLSPTLPSFHRL